MGKLKELREKRASVFGRIDELRKATDGREMTAMFDTRIEIMALSQERDEYNERTESR